MPEPSPFSVGEPLEPPRGHNNPMDWGPQSDFFAVKNGCLATVVWFIDKENKEDAEKRGLKPPGLPWFKMSMLNKMSDRLCGTVTMTMVQLDRAVIDEGTKLGLWRKNKDKDYWTVTNKGWIFVRRGKVTWDLYHSDYGAWKKMYQRLEKESQ